MTTNARSNALAGCLGLAASLAMLVPASAQTTTLYATPTPYATATLTPPAAGVIPVGTTISAKMQTQLDSGKSQAGQGFSMVVVRPYPNGDPGYAGAVVRGHIGDVQRAGQGRKASMSLVFDSIVFPSSGQSTKLAAHVLSSTKKQDTAVTQQAAGALGGMIVGNILGKAVGSNLGGVLGAAGGFAYGNNRKTNYTIPVDAEIAIQTDAEIARPQAR